MTGTSALNHIQLAAALEDADLRVLLMVLVHHTGDLSWLEPPFCPKRDVRLIPDPGAFLPDDVQERIRNAALDVLTAGRPLALVDPGDELMQRMMSVCLGEQVPPEYAALNREEMGIKSRFIEGPASPKSLRMDGHEVLIVGAGVCGIALAFSLQRMGVPFTIIDKNQDVGGTWYVNRYPGCGVDTPNHAYSYSFAADYRWSRYFSPRAEIQEYLARVVDQFGLRSHIQFGTRLEQAAWDEREMGWRCRITDSKGTHQRLVRHLVSAIGQLSDPSVPPIPGADDFKGDIFHSMHWPQDLDVRGKTVAVIGTGATAMQLVPTIAADAESVAVYQRTPQWVRDIPGYSDPISDNVQYLLRHVPMYAAWFRFNMFWRYGDGLLKFLRIDPSWEHPDRAVNIVNDRHRQEMADFIASELAERPDLIDKCIPDYPAFGKRILLNNNWYQTIQRPNVDLVTDGIENITADGILSRNGQHRKADIIVYATGFKLTELAARLNVTGSDGQTLKETWGDDGPAAYLGLMVPKFPNFFTMLGPGSGPGHGGSVVFQAECQARYITACIMQMHQQRVDAIDVKESSFESYLQQSNAEHEMLIWSHPKVDTYYKNSKGRVFTVLPWRFVDYWQMTHDPTLDAFKKYFAHKSCAGAAYATSLNEE